GYERRERIAQLVGERREKLVLAAIGLAQRSLRAGAFLRLFVSGDDDRGGVSQRRDERDVIVRRSARFSEVEGKRAEHGSTVRSHGERPAAAEVVRTRKPSPGLPRRILLHVGRQHGLARVHHQAARERVLTDMKALDVSGVCVRHADHVADAIGRGLVAHVEAGARGVAEWRTAVWISASRHSASGRPSIAAWKASFWPVRADWLSTSARFVSRSFVESKK